MAVIMTSRKGCVNGNAVSAVEGTVIRDRIPRLNVSLQSRRRLWS